MRQLYLLFGLLATATLSAGVGSATVYGPLPGNTVVFESVNDADDLFGAPTVTGDQLDFNPTDFELECGSVANPCTSNLLTGQLVTVIKANSGNFIENVVLSEAGDTSLSTFIGGDAASSSVSMSVFVDIFEIDGQGVNGINGNAQMTFTDGGAFSRDFAGSGTGTENTIWTGFLDLDLNALIAGANSSGKATGVSISLNNTLTVFAGGEAIAQIEKKDFDGLAITVVPEPGTALLMGLGLTGLALAGRKPSI